MSRTHSQLALLAVVVLLATATSATRAGAGVGVPRGDAVAYHGAWQLYRRLAEFFGRQALRAEASYWRVLDGA